MEARLQEMIHPNYYEKDLNTKRKSMCPHINRMVETKKDGGVRIDMPPTQLVHEAIYQEPTTIHQEANTSNTI